MDHLAVLAPTVAEASLLLETMAAAPVADACGAAVDGVRLGVPRSAVAICEPEVARRFAIAVEVIRDLGVHVVDVDRPDDADLDDANAAGLLVSRAEAATWHANRGTDLDRCTPETAAQLRAAGAIPATTYLRAQQRRRELTSALGSYADAHGLESWLLPTVPCVAPPVARAEDFLMLLSRNTILWSLTGFPAVSVPVPGPGLPVGAQVVTLAGADRLAVALASALERSLTGNAAGPPPPDPTPPGGDRRTRPRPPTGA